MAGEWEEEYMVVVDLMGTNEMKLHNADKLEVEMLGVASDKPVMLVNGTAFSGHFEDSIGTNIIMELKQDETPEASLKSPQTKGLEFFCKTDKKLVMERTFLFEKASVRERNQSSILKAQEVALEAADVVSVPRSLQTTDKDMVQQIDNSSDGQDQT
ncbi:general transcription factor 3C polypeptide 6-like [Pomacea canaliculata]|uniref:general transcription factor 3C polypeptide 6-like n=1 Tax=Pomacea canaliculata TaxID=400727 RepID=UPI000D73A516|nr:general transcription factor 3C polypeptide 6-like [Pomacea canaliculata]